MKIAIEGCAHGELDKIYESIRALEDEENIKVDLLICCGDFQAVRNENDLRCMAIPPKYYDICSFYKYYSGEVEAPVLTIFIGGNHEASNYLQELPYGGWVAKNIYYLGYAGAVNIGGLRIAGISGIYKGRDYMKGHFEMTPYSEDSKRSVYHIRNVEIFRLRQLSAPIDIFLSHDWPSTITQFGDEEQLLRYKPFFKDDIESGKLGSVPCTDLLHDLKPNYWFSAHLHCKFAALVDHSDGSITKFLALDKCLPRKRFMQILDIPHDEDKPLHLIYDLEWLAILHNTNHLFSTKSTSQYMPSKVGQERCEFTPTEEEKALILAKFNNDLRIPENFTKTAHAYIPAGQLNKNVHQPPPVINPQTTEFSTKLGVIDPSEILIKLNGSLDLSNLTQSSLDYDLSKSYIEDTDNDLSPEKQAKPVRTSLVLPKPLNDTTDDGSDQELNVSVNSVTDDSDTNKRENIADNDENDGNDKSNDDCLRTPNSKKFKRRNASIYDNVE